MSPSGSKDLIKEEAKLIKTKIEGFIKEPEMQDAIGRTLSVYAGILTETLLEYEEPDVVMEQAFHRIADLVKTEPYEGDVDELMPVAYALDKDVEIGRKIARKSADKLPNNLDDVHEIAIALIISDLPIWHEKGFLQEQILLLLVEMVISAITFEMATQDFCDMLVEDFINHDEHSVTESLTALSVVAGSYIADLMAGKKITKDIEEAIIDVMVREAVRHGTPGSTEWDHMTPSNDFDDDKVPMYLKDLRPKTEEFFDAVGQYDILSRAVSVTKAVGRMVAVISVEDVGQIHPSVAKSLAKSGMILGINYKEKV